MAVRPFASFIATAFILASGWLVAPLPLKADPPSIPYKITCTTGMVADIVRQVVGDKAAVQNIIGEAVDPHLYIATRSDIAELLRADVIFYNGLMLEGKMSDTFIKVARKKAVYAVTESIDRSLLLEPPEFAGHYDPHLWMDVSLWQQCTKAVAQSLSEFDPPNADYYQANYEAYASRLDELHVYARKAISGVPEDRRVLITAHDAFNYFARAYGLEVRGVQGISTESEAGIEDVNRLINLMVDRKVGAVFVETSVSQKNVESLIEGAAARGHAVRIGGSLFSDAMGKAGTYEGSYVGMIDHNVTTIARALGGNTPQRGMQGKLSTSE